MNLLVGADPELFIRDRKTNTFISGYGIIPGTKKEPYSVDRGAIQLDGMAAEFNIVPAANEQSFLINIDAVMEQLRNFIPKKYKLDISAIAEFDEKYMEEQPNECKLLGCDPDFNAYTGYPNPSPNQHPTMRTAAGHVHLGWTNGQDTHDPAHFSSCITMTKELDFYLGLPSVILDKDTKRKEMYGMAGAFRPKPYGCEYRVLSNFWLYSEALMRLIYRNTNAAFDALTSGKRLFEEHGEVAKEIINSNDKKEAKSLCNSLGIGWTI